MSDSPLVDYTAISPNSSQRTKAIRKITVHHMAGVLSVETCGRVFASPSRQASSNYGIGSDARVGLYVHENRQAWTSSSYANDQEAVTIEVSNSAVGGEWPVSDAVWSKLVDLCADICRRNGFRLTWTGDANGSLTCHYMFAATSCPGDYLRARMGQLAKEVNDRLDGKKKENDLKEIDIPKGGGDVYRLYNPNNGQHMFTTSAKERMSLVNAGWSDEGVAWRSPDAGNVAYRLYNPNNGQHMWTCDFAEAAEMQNSGWAYEGGNFAGGRSGKPVYRLYNPNNGQHMFTSGKDEADSLIGAGWRNEGTAFYAL